MATAFKMKEKVSRIWDIGTMIISVAFFIGGIAGLFGKTAGPALPVAIFFVWACLYYVNVERWKAVYASSFICSTDGEFLRHIRSDAYVLKRWLTENDAEIQYCRFQESFQAKARVFVVGVGEVVLSAEGQVLTSDSRAVFDRIVRPKVDAAEMVRSILEELLLTAEPSHVTQADLVPRALDAIAWKVPKHVLHVNVFFDKKRADRFIIPS